MGRRQRHNKKKKLDSEYHYDDKTKRYFKIAPNQFSCLKNVLTKEKINAQILEEKRLNDLTTKTLDFKDGFQSRRFPRKESMVDILYSRQCHSKISETSPYDVNNLIFSHLKCQGHFNMSTFFNDFKGWYTKKLLMNRSQDKMMALCENDDDSYSVNLASLRYSNYGLQLKNDCPIENSNEFSRIVNFECASSCRTELNDHIIDASWRTDVDCVLFAKDVRFGKGSYIDLLKYAENTNKIIRKRCHLSESLISGTCHESGKVAVGVERGIRLYDITCMSGRDTINWSRIVDPDSLAVDCVSFSNEGNVLYYSAKGSMKMYDYRKQKAMTFMSTNEKSRLGGLFMSQDGNYGMVNFCNGQIYKCDLRMKKFVLSYDGHKNDYVKLPIQVNSTEEFVAAVGIDCYTRIWNFSTGKLLKVIPPPVKALRPKFPVVSFLPQLSHVYTNTLPGLLLAVDEEMYVYI